MTDATSQHELPQVPNHELIRIIGRGSYGQIWIARSELGVMRAVKIVNRRTFENGSAFQREFDGMARFEPISREHTGFVDILHVGRDAEDEFFYYVMELADDHVDGQRIDPAHYVPKTLKTEVARRGRLLAEEVITLGLSLTEALAALHREGLIHRDIKPANIIFVGGRPKIADIGLVATSGQASFVGTEGYVPPEGPGAAQGDLYSLGKVLYELAMGKDRMDFPALHTGLDELPDREQLLRLNQVFLKACDNDPAERYQRAEQMHEDLARIQAGRSLRASGRRRLPWLLAVLLVAGGLAWGGYSAWLREARGGLVIETEPPGAMVVIGDRMVRTPARFERLPVGIHAARIMLPGFEPVQRLVQVEANAEVRLPSVVLSRSLGTLSLTSQPSGAEFTLSEQGTVVRSGRLPALLESLPAGTYELSAKLKGREKNATVEVKRAETTELLVEFPFGQLEISSQPAGAQIELDGEPSGKAPLRLLLPDGAHRVIARYPGWPDQERALEIDPNHPGDVRFAFLPGSVKITSAPGGATVVADGRELGRTPLLLEDLRPGHVRYELRLSGFEPLVLEGDVRAGEQTLLGEKFERPIGPRRGQPWENTLGMKFVPLGSEAGGGNVLFSVWPTRVKDFDAFCRIAARGRPEPDFPQGEDHPVVLVNYDDARLFCEWLTQQEIAAGKLSEGQSYRLPSDLEWSLAVGLPGEGGHSQEEGGGKIREYPWGKHWPPPAGSGNYADGSPRRAGQPVIPSYHDGFPQTSPVGVFAANRLGLYDMSGNVWQWVLEPYNPGLRWRVLRGGSWATEKPAELSLSYRNVVDPASRDVIYGFRCVLVVESRE